MSRPELPTAYDDADIAAYRALSRGEASPAQQMRVLSHLVEGIAGYYDISYRSDKDGGDRATAFHEGRRYVGAQVVKLTKLVPSGREQRTDRDPDRHARSRSGDGGNL